MTYFPRWTGYVLSAGRVGGGESSYTGFSVFPGNSAKNSLLAGVAPEIQLILNVGNRAVANFLVKNQGLSNQ